MGEWLKPGDDQNPDAILDLLEQKEAEYTRLQEEGRPVWGDDEKHRLQQDILDLKDLLKKLGITRTEEPDTQERPSSESTDILASLKGIAEGEDIANQATEGEEKK